MEYQLSSHSLKARSIDEKISERTLSSICDKTEVRKHGLVAVRRKVFIELTPKIAMISFRIEIYTNQSHLERLEQVYKS